MLFMLGVLITVLHSRIEKHVLEKEFIFGNYGTTGR